jgi:hypothetical protein
MDPDEDAVTEIDSGTDADMDSASVVRVMEKEGIPAIMELR